MERSIELVLYNLNGQLLVAQLEAPAIYGRIALPAKVKNGLYRLQVYTAEGLSNLKLQVLNQ